MTESVKSVILNPQRIQLAEYGRQDWVVNAEEGVTVEQVEATDFWAHVSAQFKPYDHIEVRAEDGAWVAEFIVLDCSRNWARVFRTAYHKIGGAVERKAPDSKYEVKFKGPQHKHCVIRKSDGEIITSGHSTAEIANASMRQHESTVG